MAQTTHPPLEPPLVEALDAIRRIIRVLRLSSSQTEREFGVTGAQLFVLQQLLDGPLGSINDLAARTLTHQSSVSVVVRRLVERGLVVRRRSPDDRRRRELHLTAAGRRLANRAPAPVQVRLIAGLRALQPRELRTLSQLLGEVVKRMGASGEPASMIFSEPPPAPRARGGA